MTEGRMIMSISTTRPSTGLLRRTAAALGLLALLSVATLSVGAAASPLAAQESEIVGSSMTVSPTRAALEMELADGATHTVAFEDGTVTVDGETVGSYEPDGALARAWRQLLAGAMDEDAGFRLDAARLRDWSPPSGGAPDATVEGLTSALDRILGAEAEPTPATDTGEAVSVTSPAGDRLTIAPGRLSVERLVDELSRLRSSLELLGSDARGAAEDLALVVHDDHAIPEGQVVDGNLALLSGRLSLGGEVRGDALVLDGQLVLEPTGRVDGDVFRVGGEVERAGGRVAGEFLSVEPASPAPAADARDRADEARERADRIEREVRDRVRDAMRRHEPGFFGSVGRNVGRAFGGVVGIAGALIVLGLIGAGLVYFLRPQLEVVADTTRHSLGRSFGVGLAGQILFFPVLLVLVVAVITWLVIPFYLAAVAAALIAGYLAVAHSTGEVLARQRYRYEWMERLRRSNSYYYVLSGLAALLLPFALAEALHLFGGWLGFLRATLGFVASVITWAAITAGFGAVLLSRGGQRTEFARPGGPTAGGAGGRRTAGGAGSGTTAGGGRTEAP